MFTGRVAMTFGHDNLLRRSSLFKDEAGFQTETPGIYSSGLQNERSAAPHNERKYIPALDGIRAIAFLLVYVAHAGWDDRVPGGLGVSIFFFLSGYLITTLLRQESQRQDISLLRFYVRRARRLLPPLYILLVLDYWLTHLGVLPVIWPVTYSTGLAVVFYYYNYFNIFHQHQALPMGLGVAWSLIIEEHFYFVFPPIFRALVRSKLSQRRQANIFLIACLLALAWRFTVPFLFNSDKAFNWTYMATDSRFDTILWGCILAIAANPLFESDPQFNLINRHKKLFAFAGLGLLMFCLLYRNEYFRDTLRYTLVSLALYPIFFFCIKNPNTSVGRVLEWRPLREIGHLSYVMYLTHDSFVHSLDQYLHLSKVVNAVLAFVCTVLFAMLMRAAVEEPLRRRLG
jgi:peptidoglycan/LPS O-acetylase OafA/YrhL